uniref:Uncharacterized protein n=1 Tax=Chromera velia CCMP2878 TaxID=1169474 RepID=A0A0G4G4P4_9ALVE|eukprot:Cvel_20231.t1-p1 / transcript=Cvel_20231.t1 / gene=Cvel_20231 / organism=Chromera_velia_CCMP2878 / gene_product=Ankyrin-2, putative / transcript_product=Ankyrin-2, putative / location=Cvel_scaffold1802:25792-26247(+) / protein_length=152 / sequence_SO=supercontig / SO=protein_coding / is_pseudo=false
MVSCVMWLPLLLLLALSLSVNSLTTLQHKKKTAKNPNVQLLRMVRRGNLAGVKRALDGKANIDWYDDWKEQRAIHLAAKGGHISILSFLIESGARLDKPTVPDHDYPLHLAVESGSVETVNVLIDVMKKKGLDIDIKNMRMSETPFLIAANF